MYFTSSVQEYIEVTSHYNTTIDMRTLAIPIQNQNVPLENDMNGNVVGNENMAPDEKVCNRLNVILYEVNRRS